MPTPRAIISTLGTAGHVDEAVAASSLDAGFKGTAPQLEKWLLFRGVSTLKWDGDGAKTLTDLLEEIKQGQCVLLTEGGSKPGAQVAVRQLSVVSVNVVQPGTQGRVLLETHMQLPGGKVRPRGLPLLQKMHHGEEVSEAAARGVLTDLGSLSLSRDDITVHNSTVKHSSAAFESASYPTLQSRYNTVAVDCTVRRLPQGNFHTVEYAPAGDAQSAPVPRLHHFWQWFTPDQVVQIRERRLQQSALRNAPAAQGSQGGGGLGSVAAVAGHEDRRQLLCGIDVSGGAAGVTQLQAALHRCAFSEEEITGTLLAGCKPVEIEGKQYLVADDIVTIRDRIRDMKIVARGDLKLSAAHHQVLLALHPESIRVEVRLLHGGFSGAMVLEGQAYAQNGDPETPCVIKLDDATSVSAEMAAMKEMAPHLRGSTCRILGHAVDGDTAGLQLELAGACWCLPELAGTSSHAASLITFKNLYLKESKVHASDDTTQTLLHTSANVLQEVFGDILFETTMGSYRVDSTPLYEVYELPRLLEKFVFSRTAIAEKKGGRIESSVEDLVPGATEVFREFAAGIAQVAAGLGDHLQGMVHGDLNGANILIDSEGVVWIIDFAHSRVSPILKDICKLESSILFEYTDLSGGQDEVVRDIIGRMARQELSPPADMAPRTSLLWATLHRLQHCGSRYFAAAQGDDNSRHPAGTPAAQWSQWVFGRLTFALRATAFQDTTREQRRLALHAAITYAREALALAGRASALSDAVWVERPLSSQELEASIRLYLHSMVVMHGTIIDPINRQPISLERQAVSLHVLTGDSRDEVMRTQADIDRVLDRAMAAQRVAGLPGRSYASSVEAEAVDRGMSDSLKTVLPLQPTEDDRLVVLLGAAASGKTVMMKRVLLAAARTCNVEAALTGEAQFLPILVLAIDLSRQMSRDGLTAEDDLLSLNLKRQFGTHSVRYRALSEVLNRGNVLLLLDGLDEAGRQKDEIQRYISRLATTTEMRIVVSSRHTGFEESVFAKFRFAQVCPLTPSIQRRIAEIRLEASPPIVRERVLKELEGGQFSEISQNPLMLSLLISSLSFMCADDSHTAITQTKLYDLGIAAMLHQAGRNKFAMRRGEDDQMVAAGLELLATHECSELLEHLSYLTHANNTRDIRAEDVGAAVASMDPTVSGDMALIASIASSLFANVQAGLVPLLMSVGDAGDGGKTMMRFSHLTFQEFLVGKYISRRLREAKRAKFVEVIDELFAVKSRDNETLSALHSPWWHKPIWFTGCILANYEAFVPFVDHIIATDDLSGANTCLLRQMVDGSQGSFQAEMAMSKTTSALRKLRPSAFLVWALLHPVAAVRNLCLTEIKEFRMDAGEIATAVIEACGGESTVRHGGVTWQTLTTATAVLGELGAGSPGIIAFLVAMWQAADETLSARFGINIYGVFRRNGPGLGAMRTRAAQSLVLLGAQTHPAVVESVCALLMPPRRGTDDENLTAELRLVDTVACINSLGVAHSDVVVALGRLLQPATADEGALQLSPGTCTKVWMCVCTLLASTEITQLTESAVSSTASWLELLRPFVLSTHQRSSKEGRVALKGVAALCGVVSSPDVEPPVCTAALAALLDAFAVIGDVGDALMKWVVRDGEAAVSHLKEGLPDRWKEVVSLCGTVKEADDVNVAMAKIQLLEVAKVDYAEAPIDDTKAEKGQSIRPADHAAQTGGKDAADTAVAPADDPASAKRSTPGKKKKKEATKAADTGEDDAVKEDDVKDPAEVAQLLKELDKAPSTTASDTLCRRLLSALHGSEAAAKRLLSQMTSPRWTEASSALHSRLQHWHIPTYASPSVAVGLMSELADTGGDIAFGPVLGYVRHQRMENPEWAPPREMMNAAVSLAATGNVNAVYLLKELKIGREELDDMGYSGRAIVISELTGENDRPLLYIGSPEDSWVAVGPGKFSKLSGPTWAGGGAWALSEDGQIPFMQFPGGGSGSIGAVCVGAESTTVSVEAWVRFDSAEDADRVVAVVAKEGGWALGASSSGTVRFQGKVEDGGAMADVVVSCRGKGAELGWVHVAAVFDGRYVTLFRNGHPLPNEGYNPDDDDTTAPVLNPVCTSPGSRLVGVAGASGIKVGPGDGGPAASVAQVRLFDTAVTADQFLPLRHTKDSTGQLLGHLYQVSSKGLSFTVKSNNFIEFGLTAEGEFIGELGRVPFCTVPRKGDANITLKVFFEQVPEIGLPTSLFNFFNGGKGTHLPAAPEAQLEDNTVQFTYQLRGNSAEENFKCHVCRNVYITPVTTDCGHTFCQYCLTCCFQRELGVTSFTFNGEEAARCPLCGQEIFTHFEENIMVKKEMESFSLLPTQDKRVLTLAGGGGIEFGNFDASAATVNAYDGNLTQSRPFIVAIRDGKMVFDVSWGGGTQHNTYDQAVGRCFEGGVDEAGELYIKVDYTNGPWEEWMGTWVQDGDDWELQDGRYIWHGWNGRQSKGQLLFTMRTIHRHIDVSALQGGPDGFGSESDVDEGGDDGSFTSEGSWVVDP